MKSPQRPPERAPAPVSEADTSSLASPILTPRGGFMARPGLKAPPTHAVVVRGGDAPLLAQIPVARPSSPPPVAPEPAATAAPEVPDKDTLQAVPKPHYLVPPRPESAPPPAMAVLESVPPVSEAPTVASVPAPALPRHSPARRAQTIAAAAAPGLVFGLASVVTTLRLDVGGVPAGAPQAPKAAPPAVPPPKPSELPSGSSEPSARVVPAPLRGERAALPKGTRRALPAPGGSVHGPAARRTIF